MSGGWRVVWVNGNSILILVCGGFISIYTGRNSSRDRNASIKRSRKHNQRLIYTTVKSRSQTKNYTEAWNNKYLGQAIHWTIVLRLFAWLSSRHLNEQRNCPPNSYQLCVCVHCSKRFSSRPEPGRVYYHLQNY